MAEQQSQPSIAADARVETEFQKLSLSILDEEHQTPLLRAVENVLSTDIAEATYAQIVDGLPLASVLEEAYGDPMLDLKHPIYQHERLCPGVLEKTKSFRDEFDSRTLQFDSRLLFAYQAASPGSRSFNTRFIEIVAVAVHQIAVLIFQSDASLHKDNSTTSWMPPKENELWWRFNPNGPPPTLFSHNWYLDHNQYPGGIGDMVGYWAEGRILGGVVLFERRIPDSDAVFFHADRADVTYRIYQLLPTQKQQLLEFLLAESPQQCPLPILPSDDNRNRVDPEEPIALTGVYRDTWERNTRPEDAGDDRSITMYDPLNYPSKMDQYEARSRYRTKYERY